MNIRKVVTWGLIAVAAVAGTYEVIRRVKLARQQKAVEQLNATKKDVTTTTKATTAANDDFPLQKGSKGQKVLDIQQKLGVEPQTGYFGDLTEGVIQLKYNTTTVDESLYDKILAEKARAGAGIAVYDLTVSSPSAVVLTRDAPNIFGKAVKDYRYGQTVGTVTKALFDAAPATSYLGLMGSTKQYVQKKDVIVFKQRTL